jgi:hypothetical protein
MEGKGRVSMRERCGIERWREVGDSDGGGVRVESRTRMEREEQVRRRASAFRQRAGMTCIEWNISEYGDGVLKSELSDSVAGYDRVQTIIELELSPG